MADPWQYTYPSPLDGYENLPPLPDERAEDGKAFVNPPSDKRSSAYEKFPAPLTNGRRGGFDIHIYFLHTDAYQSIFAKQLWERIRREFPELRIYQVFDRPIGPHPVGMFEVNLFTPAQFGAFIPWLVINRGPLSALVHPNTDSNVEEGSGAGEGGLIDHGYRDHTQRAIWMGERYPLNLGLFKKIAEVRAQKAAQADGKVDEATKEKADGA